MRTSSKRSGTRLDGIDASPNEQREGVKGALLLITRERTKQGWERRRFEGPEIQTDRFFLCERNRFAAHAAPPFSDTTSADGRPVTIAPTRSVAARSGSSNRCA